MSRRRRGPGAGERRGEVAWAGAGYLVGNPAGTHEEVAARLASEWELICRLGRRVALMLAASEVRLVASELRELMSFLMESAWTEGGA